MVHVRMRVALLSLGGLILAVGLTAPAPGQNVVVRRGKPEPLTDEKALAAARLSADDADGLITYLKLRTLSEVDAKKIDEVIQRLGAESFEERLQAEIDAEKFGPAAVAPLRRAATINPDQLDKVNFEVAYRAELVLKRLETVPHSAVALAAVRTLAKTPHADSVPTLLAFLPAADSAQVAAEVRSALVKLAAPTGQANPALVAALKHAKPNIRTAAALALLKGGPNGQPVPDSLAQVQAMAKSEPDAKANFEILLALAASARDPDALTRLIGLTSDLPRGQLWQVEDLLLQIAGTDAPIIAFGKSPQARGNARDVWAKWWTDAQPKMNLSKVDYQPRTEGRVILVVGQNSTTANGYVSELDATGQEEWRIANLMNPTDALVLADGSVVTGDLSANELRIRSKSGELIGSRLLTGPAGRRVTGQPMKIQALPDGGLLITCRNVVLELPPDLNAQTENKVVFDRANNFDIVTAVRLESGVTVALVHQGPKFAYVLGDDEKEVPGKGIKSGVPYYTGSIAATGPDRVLITEVQQIAEYALDGKGAVWTARYPEAKCVQRLSNGNTLLVDRTGRAVEISPAGEELWDYRLPGGVQLLRAYRR